MSENILIHSIVGHGIKDLADKESFVVFLSKALVEKFLPIIKKVFERYKLKRFFYGLII